MEGKGEPNLLEEGMRPREGKGLGHRHTASEQLCPQVGVTPGFVPPRLQHVEEAGCVWQQRWEPQPLGCKSEGLGEEKGLRTVTRCGCVPPAGRGCQGGSGVVTAQLEPNRVSTAQCRQMGGRGAPHDQGSLQACARLFLEAVTWESDHPRVPTGPRLRGK